jgi:hypothetical protein
MLTPGAISNSRSSPARRAVTTNARLGRICAIERLIISDKAGGLPSGKVINPVDDGMISWFNSEVDEDSEGIRLTFFI